jgi:hypothetical protein
MRQHPRPARLPRRRRKIPERFERVGDFGHELRGLGSRQTTHVRAFKGATFGAASEGRSLSLDERQAIEQQMRRDGKL